MEPLRFAPAVQQGPVVKGPVAGEADVLQALRHLGDRGFIRFHPVLAEQFGHKAALLLGLALYWTRHSLDHQPRRKGWFYMTARQWQQAVGLSGREQSTARAALVREGLLQESLNGCPAMLHFRADLAKVSAILGHAVTTVAPEAETHPLWSSNCVCYYKPLADLTGNVACGLYLSHLLQLQRKAVLSQQVRSDALHVSQDNVSIALCLGPKVQRNARERLRQAGLIRETGPSLAVLNLPAIMACLQAQEGRLLPHRRKTLAPSSPMLSPMLSLVRPIASGMTVGPDAAGPQRQRQIAPLLGAFAQLPLGLMSLARPTSASDGSVGQDCLIGHSSALRASLAGACSLPGIIPSFVTPAPKAKADPIPASRSVAEHDRGLNGLPGTAAVAENAKLDQLSVAENAKLRLPKTQSHISISISNTTTTHTRVQPVNDLFDGSKPRRRRISFDPSLRAEPVGKSYQAPRQVASSNLDALIYPECLEPAYLPSVRSVLAKAPVAHRQALLDELDGQLHTQGKTIHNPAGWLMGLIRQQRESGTVVLAMAQKVAADREHRLRVQAQVERARQGHAVVSATAEPTTVADPAVVAVAREKLRVLRAEFMVKRG